MGHILTGDQALAAFRKLGEISRQLGQEQYPHDPDRLLGALQAVTEGRFEAVVGGQFSSLIHAADLIPEYTDDADGRKRKWEVVEDVTPSQFDINKLKPCSFLKGESLISGEEMRKRAVEFKGNLGLSDGKRMLAEQDKIPPEFRDFYIPLPGTLLRDPDGDLRVPVLRWGGLALAFDWLDDGWFGGGRFACSE